MDVRITIIIIKKAVHSVYFSCVISVISFFLFAFIIYDCVFSILSDFAGVVVIAAVLIIIITTIIIIIMIIIILVY